jgi:endonuclease III
MARSTTRPSQNAPPRVRPAGRAPAATAGVAKKGIKNAVKKPGSAGKSAAGKPAAGESAAPKQAVASGPATRAKADAAAATAAIRPWNAQEIAEAFSRWRAANPEPKGELEHVNPFTLLVAVVLSAQATDAGVNKATRPLFAQCDTPRKMLALGEERLREAIKTIGLFRTKAKNVIALCERLVNEHGGAVPRERAALEALPGVGRKTANVVLNMAFGEPTIAVDTHVFRVGNRTGLAPGRSPFEVETRLEEVVPAQFKQHAHHWLILHGRYVCKAQRPLCESCIVSDLCRWPGKTVVAPPRLRSQTPRR